MGNCWARVFRRRTVRRHIVLILIGLDNAGKTKTVNNLAGDKDESVLPTVGFKAVNLVHKDTPVTVYDLGGGPHFRQIWPQYYSEVHGVIFVIDSSDFARLDECRTVLEEVLSHDKISGKPVLVLANKQDKTGALDDIDVVEKLNIEPLVNRYRCPTLVESYSALPSQTKSRRPKIDPGLRKGYQWLLNYVVRRYGDINLRVQTDIHADLERRKRMLSKASNTTNLSDDIATQTGFENPNFDIDKPMNNTKLSMQEGVIIVKPISNSVDSTVTIESIETESTSPGQAKPKLSPLFGTSSGSTVTETVRIELEPRTEYRKLSPIVRKSGVNQHIDFGNRPQSSPTFKRKGSQSTVSQEDTPLDQTYIGHNRTWDGPGRGKTLVLDEVHINNVNKEVNSDKEYTNKSAHSEVTAPAAAVALSPRPASASQLVRKQLELCGPQRRRLSLRYIPRNKTSPERNTMMMYDAKHRRHLDKGDFQHANTLN